MASYAGGSAVWPPEICDIPLDEIGTTGFGLAAAVDVALVGGYPQSLRRQRHSKHCCRSAGTAVLCQVDGPSGLTDIKARGRDPAYF